MCSAGSIRNRRGQGISALKTAHSGPHGLKEDQDGNIWYTGNTGSLIGKLDPKTGAVTEYPMPEPGDPHTLIFDAAASCGSRCRTRTTSGASTRTAARSNC